METWEQDFHWLRVRHFIKGKFNKQELPDLNAILFLIGLQEFGQMKTKFTKEEKQDLMHIAVCRLMSEDGYYEFDGMDTAGWPHWKPIKTFHKKGVEAQSIYLKEKVINYFAGFLEEE